MFTNLRLFSFSFITVVAGIMITFSVLANLDTGLFSDENFTALKKDPAALFSKPNTCRLKKLIGEKDFDLFNQAMSLMTDEEDEPDYVSISGNVKGLFTIFEGFFRMSKSGKIWIAYLYDNEVHYFTNDESSLKLPPKIILNWSSRFKEAKWVSKFLTIKVDNCK